MSSHRVSKMSSVVRAELARLLIHEVGDPRVHDLVVTEVDLTGDLKRATVFYNLAQRASQEIDDKKLSQQEKERKKGLEKVTPFLRKRLGQNLELRYVPELVFRLDKHGDEVSKLMGLFKEIEEE